MFDRYLENLPRAYHEPILQSIAGTWLPVDICVAHYKAIDALGLAVTEQVQLGKEAIQRLQKTIFSMAFHAVREAGVTPFRILRSLPSAWDREWKGGGIAVWKVGPKDARVEIVGFPGCAIPYCRNGIRGIAMGMCELVCTKAYAQEIRGLTSSTTLGIRVSWA
jgi:hypothetical protein